jgi:molecular chaperone DnaK
MEKLGQEAQGLGQAIYEGAQTASGSWGSESVSSDDVVMDAEASDRYGPDI